MLIVTVIHADGPSLGKQWLFEGYDWDGAVEKVCEVLREQFGLNVTAEVIAEIQNDSGYTSENGEYAVLIGMSETNEDE